MRGHNLPEVRPQRIHSVSYRTFTDRPERDLPIYGSREQAGRRLSKPCSQHQLIVCVNPSSWSV